MNAPSRNRVARRAVAALAVVGAAWALSASGVVEVIVQRLALGKAPGPADFVTRLSANDVECPSGTSLRRSDPAPDGRAKLWCETTAALRSVRHGSYIELYPDGSTARQGSYLRGRQVGAWVRWAPAGKAETVTVLRPGESSRHIPEPEELCPPGTTRHRSFGFDDRRRMWSECTAPGTKGKQGKEVLAGPHVTWDEEPAPDGGTRYVLRDLMTYRDDERHGPHLVFAGPFAREMVVERETYDDGRLVGESRSFFLDGTVRESRNYREGELDGVRVGYAPDGSERWRVTYELGRVLATKGDLTVANEPCPEPSVPTFAADGKSAFCARRYQHFLERSGPYIVWDAEGRVVESGLYESNEKKRLWIAPEGVELPPEVSDQTQVAAIELFVGDEPYSPDRTPRGEEKTDPVHVWFRSNRDMGYPRPRTEIRGNLVAVYGLAPGSYYMEVDVDANTSNDVNWPGDLVAALDFSVTEGEVTRRPAKLLYTIRLRAPRDNDIEIPGWRYPCKDPQAVLAGPVHFAWERPPVDPAIAVSYKYRLTRRECDTNQEIERADGETTVPALTLELPSSRPGELYEWGVSAWAGDKVIGQLMTFAGGGYGWSLRFRVP